MRALRRRVLHERARLVDKAIRLGAVRATIARIGPCVVALQQNGSIPVVERTRSGDFHPVMSRAHAERLIALAVDIDCLAVFDTLKAQAVMEEDGTLVAIAIGLS